MDRRRLIGIAAACVAMPHVARAQLRPVIGYLTSRGQQESAPHLAGFRHGLSELGFTEGRDVLLEYRWAEGRYERLPAMAAELLAKGASVIAAVGGAPSALAAKAATRDRPVVYVIGDDPVQIGLAQTLARPGGNLTGVSFLTSDLGAKRLSLLCELLPRSSTIGLLLHPDNPGAEEQRRQLAAAAPALRRRLMVVQADREGRFEGVFEALARERVDGLVVQNDASFDSQRERLIALCARHAMPAIYHIREFPAAGGLMSYGASLVDAYRQAGRYVGRVLKGEKAAEMPVWRPTTFELVINAATAHALRIVVPQSLLLGADEVVG